MRATEKKLVALLMMWPHVTSRRILSSPVKSRDVTPRPTCESGVSSDTFEKLPSRAKSQPEKKGLSLVIIFSNLGVASATARTRCVVLLPVVSASVTSAVGRFRTLLSRACCPVVPSLVVVPEGGRNPGTKKGSTTRPGDRGEELKVQATNHRCKTSRFGESAMSRRERVVYG